MAVITDLYSKRVLFSDGEGLDLDDLNNLIGYAQAQVIDNLIVSSVPDAIDDPTALGTTLDPELGAAVNGSDYTNNDLIFAPHPACGYIKASGSANALITVAGPIIMSVIPDFFDAGNESIATFRLPGGTSLATAVGHATLPRIDIVEVKLEYVDANPTARHYEDATTREKTSETPDIERAVQCTIQIKAGTPGATPAYPTPTAGFVAMAAVRIPATHNAVHSPLNIRDLRMPLGHVTAYDVSANQMWVPGANPWVITQGNPAPQLSAVGPAASTGTAYAICPVASKTARLVGIGIYSHNAADAALVAIDHTAPAAPTITTLADLGGGAGFQLVGATGYYACAMLELMAALETTGAFPGTRAASTRIGTPMWCSGYPAGAAKPITALPETISRQLAVAVVGAAADQLAFVRFFVAHGL